jgi:1,2-phenylacetyl-CoA epoxidase catalytic subunit
VSSRFELPDSSDEVVASLASVVVAVADNKYFLAHRLAEWGVGAPSLEAAVACTAIAQEEAGHARGLYSLLAAFPEATAPVPLEREDDRVRKYCVGYLLEPNPSWYAAVASLVLIDRALTELVEAAADSAFAELRKRAVRILGDESFHRRFADGRVLELAVNRAEARALADQFARLLPETLCWFGPEGEPGLEALVEAGVVDAGNEELRQRFLRGLGELQERVGLSLPTEQEDGRWTYPELPWSDWNSLERRLPAAPIRASA